MYSHYREKLAFELMTLQNVFIDNVLCFKKDAKLYDILMQTAIENGEPYISKNELQIFHQNTKEAILQKVWSYK